MVHRAGELFAQIELYIIEASEGHLRKVRRRRYIIVQVNSCINTYGHAYIHFKVKMCGLGLLSQVRALRPKEFRINTTFSPISDRFSGAGGCSTST